VVHPVGQPGWLEALQEVVRREGITHVFPAHDDALVALAEHAGEFRPAKIVTSPLATCQLTRSKLQTRRLLEGVVPTPAVYPGVAEVPTYPVFLKPDRGQGSQRTDRAEDATMLSELLARDPDRAIWEFLPGEEYTIDCFSDRERGLLHASGRERVRIRAGIAMHSRRVDLPVSPTTRGGSRRSCPCTAPGSFR
jgi:carbamoyl-phosphate synthase large subunit